MFEICNLVINLMSDEIDRVNDTQFKLKSG